MIHFNYESHYVTVLDKGIRHCEQLGSQSLAHY